MSLIATLAPEGIKLLKQYLDEGKVEKSTLRASMAEALDAVKDTTPADIRMLGLDMIVIGNCLVDVAANHSPSDGHIPPIKPEGESGLTVEKY